MVILENRVKRLEAHAGKNEELVWAEPRIKIPGAPSGGWVPRSWAEGPRITIPDGPPSNPASAK